MTKDCLTLNCGPKDISEFGDDRSREDGKNPYCRSCCSARMQSARDEKRRNELHAKDLAISTIQRSEEVIERNRIKREQEEQIAHRLKESENHEDVEPLSFAGLCSMLGRQGNRSQGWTCPIGATSR